MILYTDYDDNLEDAICIVCGINPIASTDTMMCGACWSPNDEKEYSTSIPQHNLYNKDTFEMMFKEVA